MSRKNRSSVRGFTFLCVQNVLKPLSHGKLGRLNLFAKTIEVFKNVVHALIKFSLSKSWQGKVALFLRREYFVWMRAQNELIYFSNVSQAANKLKKYV